MRKGAEGTGRGTVRGGILPCLGSTEQNHKTLHKDSLCRPNNYKPQELPRPPKLLGVSKLQRHLGTKVSAN